MSAMLNLTGNDTLGRQFEKEGGKKLVVRLLDECGYGTVGIVFNLAVTSTETGSCFRKGIKIKASSALGVNLLVQPGDNGTCKKCFLYAPKGVNPEKFREKLELGLADLNKKPEKQQPVGGSKEISSLPVATVTASPDQGKDNQFIPPSPPQKIIKPAGEGWRSIGVFLSDSKAFAAFLVKLLEFLGNGNFSSKAGFLRFVTSFTGLEPGRIAGLYRLFASRGMFAKAKDGNPAAPIDGYKFDREIIKSHIAALEAGQTLRSLRKPFDPKAAKEKSPQARSPKRNGPEISSLDMIDRLSAAKKSVSQFDRAIKELEQQIAKIKRKEKEFAGELAKLSGGRKSLEEKIRTVAGERLEALAKHGITPSTLKKLEKLFSDKDK